jgi:O-succinylbenzoic acid--CoA ligase
MAKIVLADNTFTPATFCAARFTEDWLRDVQACISFWLSEEEFLEVTTSGTTSAPKPMLLPRQLLQTSAAATLTFLGITSGAVLLAIPAKYIGGKMLLFRALAADLDIHLIEPKVALPALAEKFALVSLTPLQVANSLYQLHNFRTILIGGGPISASLEEQLQHREAAIYHTYGMTETASHVALRRVNGPNKTAAFEALPGITFSMDERHCLIIHAEAWHIGTLITNDVVELVNDHTFVWLGRVDHVINSGGLKLHPEQIEHLLEQHLATPFFVASVPDEALGQKLVLIVEGAERPIDFSAIPKLQQPRQVFFIPQFAYTETDKINRQKTLDLLALK